MGSRGIRSIALAAALAGGGLVVVGSLNPSPARAATLSIPALVRDFDHEPAVNAPASHPDFEDAFGEDPGIVQETLGSDGKPVYGSPTGGTTHGATAFDQWFHNSALGKNVPINLAFDQTGSQLTYDGIDFFPIDGKGWNDPAVGDGIGQVDDGHNFSFTMELHMTFTYDSATDQQFTFEGDDDVFVFFNKHLEIDLGGVHGSESQSVDIKDIAADDGMVSGQTYPIDIFYAERHTTGSDFNIDANFAVAAAATTTTTTSTSTSSTSTTTPSSTSTTRPATSTTKVLNTTIARTGSNDNRVATAGIGLLVVGALLGLVDRNRYRGEHFLKR